MKDRLPLIIIQRKENGKLVYDGFADQVKDEAFIASLEEGDRVSTMREMVNMDSTHAQNNLFHKMCRTIAQDTGSSLGSIKNALKYKAGFYKTKDELKSTGDMTKEEMSHLIQITQHFAAGLNINLY